MAVHRSAANGDVSGHLLGDASTSVGSFPNRYYAQFLPELWLDDNRNSVQQAVSEIHILPSRMSPVPSVSWLSSSLGNLAIPSSASSFVSLSQVYGTSTSQALGCSDCARPSKGGVIPQLGSFGGLVMSSTNGFSEGSVSPGVLPQISQLHISDDLRPQSIQTMYQRPRDFQNGSCDSPGRCFHEIGNCSSSTSRQPMNRRESRRLERRNSFGFEMDPLNDNHGTEKEEQGYLVVRSPEEYTSLNQVKGMMVAIAKTHRGSEFLKERCKIPEDLETVFLGTRDRIFELTRDTFGNGLVRCLLKSCNSTKREEIVSRLARQKDQFYFLSCDVYGTRVVQELVDVIKLKTEISLVREALSSRVLSLIKDDTGNRVVKRWLTKFKDGEDADANNFLIDVVVHQCVGIANHQHGHAIVKECVDCAKGNPKVRLINEITANALRLSQDYYGNYVLQHVLIQGQPWITVEVVNKLKGNFASLSVHTCGTNVVEKCMEFGGEKETTQIIKELLESPCPLQILDDQYGNCCPNCVRALKGIRRSPLSSRLHI